MFGRDGCCEKADCHSDKTYKAAEEHAEIEVVHVGNYKWPVIILVAAWSWVHKVQDHADDAHN